MKIRTIMLIVAGLIIALGLFSGLFAQSIQHVLTPTPSAAQGYSQSTTGAMPPMAGQNVTQTPAALNPGGLPATATPLPNAPTVLAQDTFQRTDQPLWGTASDGRAWQGDANKQGAGNIFTIANNIGVIANAQGTFNALLGPSGSDAEVLVSGSVSHFNAPNVNFGVVLRWTDNNDWYKALLDGNNLTVLSRVNGVTTQLGTVSFAAQAGTNYSIRFRSVGSTLFAKAWASNTTEPPNWMLTLTDTTLTTGQGGVRVLLQNGVVVHVTSFLETTVSGMM
jgi:hypothetical protein